LIQLFPLLHFHVMSIRLNLKRNTFAIECSLPLLPYFCGQLGANCMLEDWEENLAVITANRTKDDELVIIHLGDCLWREKSEVD